MTSSQSDEFDLSLLVVLRLQTVTDFNLYPYPKIGRLASGSKCGTARRTNPARQKARVKSAFHVDDS